jgi:hypothetical protein
MEMTASMPRFHNIVNTNYNTFTIIYNSTHQQYYIDSLTPDRSPALLHAPACTPKRPPAEMPPFVVFAIITLACLTSAASLFRSPFHNDFNFRSPEQDELEQYKDQFIRNSTFRQPIDHENHDIGSFEQWYWYNTEFWGGPGSPIILYMSGEQNASPAISMMTPATTVGILAQQIGAAVVLLEHRYWGESSPYVSNLRMIDIILWRVSHILLQTELTTANLTHLTVHNAIKDSTTFARNVELPFDHTGQNRSNAANAPWILVGGSYAGALAAWTASVDPGTFWAYLASSAVVEAKWDFWYESNADRAPLLLI